MMNFLLFGSILVIINSNNAIFGQQILNLPGIPKQAIFKHYSGYLNASTSRFLHYWFVESQSNPSKDPVVLWMNGGPGCSSLDGLLSELGPFLINDDGATLTMNPYAWNRKANVIFLEAPAGVGFSYSSDDNVTTDDDLTSALNYAALKHFFTIYPQFRNSDFYITGESYGGIYVPTLAQRVAMGLDSFALKFKGIAIGNGMLDFNLNQNTIIEFAYHHGLIDEKTWKITETVCCSGCGDTCNFIDPDPGYCNQTVYNLMYQIYELGLNMYDLYRDCYNPTPSDLQRFHFDVKKAFPKHGHLLEKHKKNVRESVPCLNDTAITMYLNRADVRKALHIPEEVPAWYVCSETVGRAYTTIYKNVNSQIQLLIDSGIRIMIYNGDTDMACNFLMNQKFVAGLNRELKSPKHQWRVDNQVAGYVTRFKGLDFVTIKGTGHMVPQWKPKQAYYMIKSFLDNVPL